MVVNMATHKVKLVQAVDQVVDQDLVMVELLKAEDQELQVKEMLAVAHQTEVLVAEVAALAQ
jgi:ribosomal protein L18